MTTERIAAYLLTGFLGSGKTTLLREMLRNEAFRDTAVIVNELGEIGLDHDLISFSSDSTIVMPGGCVCCTIREDIETALRELFEARDAGRIPPFSRLVIETTGIADPIPLLMTLHSNPLAQSRLRKPRVITVVDGVLGLETLAGHREAEAQVTNADIVIISKADLAGDAALDTLRDRIPALNPWAEVRSSNLLAGGVATLFADVDGGDGRARDFDAWLGNGRPDTHAHGHDGIRSHSLMLDRPLDWTAFGVWMTMLLHRHGDRVLRVKGILDVDGLPGPTVFQSAQHLVHPPLHMDEWPSADRRSRLVFILRDLDPTLIEASLRAFDRAATTAVERVGDYRPAGGGGVIAGRPVRRPTAPGWIKG